MNLREGWEWITDNILYNDERELAIVQTLTSEWIVLQNKDDPAISGVYRTVEEAYLEWSHA